MNRFTIILASLLAIGVKAQIAPCGPLPNANQLRWQDMEMYAFIHYSLNTYTDQEWGFGNEDPKLFNPSSLDCRQWARACKLACEASSSRPSTIADSACGPQPIQSIP